jgi:F0F1-type ATP synthase delta subunit
MSCVSVQAPLQQYGTSGRYATALYVAATKAGNLSAVEGEVAQVRDATRAKTRSTRRTTATRAANDS